jgi:hypothetical protein
MKNDAKAVLTRAYQRALQEAEHSNARTKDVRLSLLGFIRPLKLNGNFQIFFIRLLDQAY